MRFEAPCERTTGGAGMSTWLADGVAGDAMRIDSSIGAGVPLGWAAVAPCSLANPMATEVRPLVPTTGVARTASDVSPLAPTTGVRITAGDVRPLAAVIGVEKTASDVRPLAPTTGDGITAREVRPLTPRTGVTAPAGEGRLLPAPTGVGGTAEEVSALVVGMTTREVKPLAPTTGVKNVAALCAGVGVCSSGNALADMSGMPATMTKELGTLSTVPVVGALASAVRLDSRLTSAPGVAIKMPEASVVPTEPIGTASWLLATTTGVETGMLAPLLLAGDTMAGDDSLGTTGMADCSTPLGSPLIDGTALIDDAGTMVTPWDTRTAMLVWLSSAFDAAVTVAPSAVTMLELALLASSLDTVTNGTIPVPFPVVMVLIGKLTGIVPRTPELLTTSTMVAENSDVMAANVLGVEVKPYPRGTPSEGPLGNGSLIT